MGKKKARDEKTSQDGAKVAAVRRALAVELMQAAAAATRIARESGSRLDSALATVLHAAAEVSAERAACNPVSEDLKSPLVAAATRLEARHDRLPGPPPLNKSAAARRVLEAADDMVDGIRQVMAAGEFRRRLTKVVATAVAAGFAPGNVDPKIIASELLEDDEFPVADPQLIARAVLQAHGIPRKKARDLLRDRALG